MDKNSNKKIPRNRNTLITLAKASMLTGYAQEYLNLRCRQGKLQGVKRGRNWHTTRAWLAKFQESIVSNRKGEKDRLEKIQKIYASQEPDSYPEKQPKAGSGLKPEPEISGAGYKPVSAPDSQLENKPDNNLGQNLISQKEENALPGNAVIQNPQSLPEMAKNTNSENERRMLRREEIFSDALAKATEEKKSEVFSSAKKWTQTLAGVSAMIIIIPIIFFSVYSVKYYAAQKNYETEKIALVNETPSEIIINENENNFSQQDAEEKVLGIVAGDNTTADPEAQKKSRVVLAGKNFKAQNFSIGTGVVLASAEENAPLEITDVKSESFITGKKNNANSQEEVKLVVSWKTNKPAISELSFSKNSGQEQKVLKENSFGFNHAVVLAGIDPQTAYVYQVKSKDHWGTEVSSDFYGLFSASKSVSVFDLISNQMNEIFGWTVKQ